MDFGCPVNRGRYLPALQRYDGMFYKEFGDQNARRLYLADKHPKHHLLIGVWPIRVFNANRANPML
jgi:hypothetical protein